jgi:hypothetical protein
VEISPKEEYYKQLDLEMSAELSNFILSALIFGKIWNYNIIHQSIYSEMFYPKIL